MDVQIFKILLKIQAQRIKKVSLLLLSFFKQI